MRARITPDELAGQQLVTPDWFPCECTRYVEEPANTDGSTNCIIYGKVIGPKFTGARWRILYNEKAMGMAGNFLKALGAKVVAGVGIDADMSEGTIVGKLLDVHIVRGESNKGNPFNDPKEFAPIGQITKFNAEEYLAKKNPQPVKVG